MVHEQRKLHRTLLFARFDYALEEHRWCSKCIEVGQHVTRKTGRIRETLTRGEQGDQKQSVKAALKGSESYPKTQLCLRRNPLGTTTQNIFAELRVGTVTLNPAGSQPRAVRLARCMPSSAAVGSLLRPQ